jgi:hypothetical protein
MSKQKAQPESTQDDPEQSKRFLEAAREGWGGRN